MNTFLNNEQKINKEFGEQIVQMPSYIDPNIQTISTQNPEVISTESSYNEN